MELTDEDIRAFAAIGKKEFKEEIGVAEARTRASQLMGLYLLLAKVRREEAEREEKTD
jgi:hypothetical protein